MGETHIDTADQVVDASGRVQCSIARPGDGADLATAMLAAGWGQPDPPRFAYLQGTRLPVPVWPAASGLTACPGSGGWAADELVMSIHGASGAAAGFAGPTVLKRISTQNWGVTVGTQVYQTYCSGDQMIGQIGDTMTGDQWYGWLPLPGDYDPRGLYAWHYGSSPGDIAGAGMAVLDHAWG